MYDFLIIGHGIAGAVLSHELLQRGHHVMVIDQPKNNQSSAVAAGLYNPVTGRKMVKTWMADQLFPEIESTYEALEAKLNIKCLHKIGIYRPFVDIAELNDWEGKKTNPAFQPYIQSVNRSSIEGFDLKDPAGGLHVRPSGYLDIPTFLVASRAYLIEHDAYTEIPFEEKELTKQGDHFTYHDVKFKKLICCNGLGAQNSKLFGWLPFSPVKGEMLVGKIRKTIDKIYNRGIFIVPAGEQLVKVGATYKNTFENTEPTDAGKKELLEKMTNLTNETFHLLDTKVGIRPATKDRKPFIGKHPEYEHIYVFNGFGSKGVSLVPFFTKMLVDYLENKSSLNDDVNVQRYASLYASLGLF